MIVFHRLSTYFIHKLSTYVCINNIRYSLCKNDGNERSELLKQYSRQSDNYLISLSSEDEVN